MKQLMQLIKFGAVGLANNVIYYLVYLLLIHMRMHYLAANILGFLSSVGNAYYWNSRYVFPAANEEHKENVADATEENPAEYRGWKTLLKTFLAYAGTGLVLNNLLLVIWIDGLNLNKTIAPILNLCITVPVNFVLNKYWAFKQTGGKTHETCGKKVGICRKKGETCRKKGET